jgi:hypothetical protein
MPTTEQNLIIKELEQLSRDHATTIEYIADLASSGIVSTTPGVVDKLIQARGKVDEALEEFREYNLMVGVKNE